MSDNMDIDDMLGIDGEEVEVSEKPQEASDKKFVPGVGVDVGTSNIVVARQTEDGTFVNRFHRNMLYPLDASEEAKDLLERSESLYVEVGNQYYIVGEDALTMVNIVNEGEIIRPMKDGILNPSLKESSQLLFYIIKAVVGDPIVPNEPLRFSVPANPVDQDLDNVFHKMVLANFFKQMGYSPEPLNEAMCLCYDANPIMKADEGDVPLTGITCSCGAGMWNVALSYKGLSLVEFSCTKSGDYLDDRASKMTGVPTGKVIRIKEKKLDLDNVDMSEPVSYALSIYYDEVLERMVRHIAATFKDKGSELDGEIEVVVGGGTSMAPGFCKRLDSVIKRLELPFDIRQVRQAENPFYAVSQGSCLRARADYAKAQEK